MEEEDLVSNKCLKSSPELKNHLESDKSSQVQVSTYTVIKENGLGCINIENCRSRASESPKFERNLFSPELFTIDEIFSLDTESKANLQDDIAINFIDKKSIECITEVKCPKINGKTNNKLSPLSKPQLDSLSQRSFLQFIDKRLSQESDDIKLSEVIIANTNQQAQGLPSKQIEVEKLPITDILDDLSLDNCDGYHFSDFEFISDTEQNIPLGTRNVTTSSKTEVLATVSASKQLFSSQKRKSELGGLDDISNVTTAYSLEETMKKNKKSFIHSSFLPLNAQSDLRHSKQQVKKRKGCASPGFLLQSVNILNDEDNISFSPSQESFEPSQGSIVQNLTDTRNQTSFLSIGSVVSLGNKKYKNLDCQSEENIDAQTVPSWDVSQPGPSSGIFQPGLSREILQSGPRREVSQLGPSSTVTRLGSSREILEPGPSREVSQLGPSSRLTRLRSSREILQPGSIREVLRPDLSHSQELPLEEDFVNLFQHLEPQVMPVDPFFSSCKSVYCVMSVWNGDIGPDMLYAEHIGSQNSTSDSELNTECEDSLKNIFQEFADENITSKAKIGKKGKSKKQ